MPRAAKAALLLLATAALLGIVALAQADRRREAQRGCSYDAPWCP